MDTKISISRDEETVPAIEERVLQERGVFRHKSYFLELATPKMQEEL